MTWGTRVHNMITFKTVAQLETWKMDKKSFKKDPFRNWMEPTHSANTKHSVTHKLVLALLEKKQFGKKEKRLKRRKKKM